MSTVTMQELELETAELLPARETLCSGNYGSHGGNTTNIVGSGDGNTEQAGIINVSALNGNFDGEGNNVLNLLGF
jgi:hypothetical protein